MIDEATIRQFFRRLNHKPFGLTELVAIDKGGKGIRATGFYTDEDAFLTACSTLSESNNLYAGRNPRPFFFFSSPNKMDSVIRLRASDVHINTLTAISLDIDPIRPKDQPATTQQRETALKFAFLLQRFLGGYIDDSGNGAYLWLPFFTPIHLTPTNTAKIKSQCQYWQKQIGESFSPSDHGLRIDGCFDFSRIKRVIGTFNHKARRLSSLHLGGRPSDTVREEILSLPLREKKKPMRVTSPTSMGSIPDRLPSRFLQLLKEDHLLRDLWTTTPTPCKDRSSRDWMLGRYCVERGIMDPGELAVILRMNPLGKYQRDKRGEYVERSVEKLLSG
jgi:hypothetical protein